MASAVDINSLNKSIAFAAPSHRIPVEIDELKFAERLKHLLNIRLGEIEMERANVKSTRQCQGVGEPQ
jgi:hypothetical protein